ncbi:hypothetical protein AB6735_04150 [Mucilaginibacter sp. RCC_168]|uniref:hypothetical protein n=1 Tax=Mucilaginibacter sp. RCC_168 TaxID=3239221 RepID=UPI00352500D5
MLFVTISYAQKATGGDRDKHGCIGSAGYTYSIIKKDCIQTFAQKIKLKEVDPKRSFSTIAAVIFSDDNKKAEIFLSDYKESQILIRTGKKGNYVWKKGDLKLTDKDGYQLKKGKKLIYSL